MRKAPGSTTGGFRGNRQRLQRLGDGSAILKDSVPSEHLEQVYFVAWFRREFAGVRIFAIPNGGSRGIREASRFKAEGVSAGVPDLFVPAWSLWVEMKRQKGGTVSAEQKDWHQYLLEIGDTVMVCRGCDDAIAQVTEWRQTW
jgi:hypothetical protein